jgi:hypothetical protein
MRVLAALLLALALISACGCSSTPHSIFNGRHLVRHFTIVFEDLHHLHVDLDRVLLDIYEYDESMAVRAN